MLDTPNLYCGQLGKLIGALPSAVAHSGDEQLLVQSAHVRLAHQSFPCGQSDFLWGDSHQ